MGVLKTVSTWGVPTFGIIACIVAAILSGITWYFLNKPDDIPNWRTRLRTAHIVVLFVMIAVAFVIGGAFLGSMFF